MKKMFLLSAAITVLICSCKKDKTEPLPQNEPGQEVLKPFLDNNNIVDTVIQRNVNNLELGMRFYPATDGVITHLGCRMPYPGDFNVSLWDYDTKELIATIAVPNYPDKFSYGDIKDVTVYANKRYVISVNNFADGSKRSYFISDKKSSSTTLYPFSKGKITFEAVHSKVTSVPAFPDAVTPNNQEYIPGYADFMFK